MDPSEPKTAEPVLEEATSSEEKRVGIVRPFAWLWSLLTRPWIPRNNPAAVAGYYFGFFSWLIVVGFLFAPAALTLSVYGYRQAKLDPKMEGRSHAIVGIVMAVLSLLVQPVITILLWNTWEYQIRTFFRR